jgi:hypothetical protein
MRALAVPALTAVIALQIGCDAFQSYESSSTDTGEIGRDSATPPSGGGGGGGGGGGDTESDTEARNNPPMASAGPDQFDVAVGATAYLDGSGSSDVDNDPLTYAWSISIKPPGSNPTLSNASFSTATLVPDKTGTYEVILTVNDGRGGADNDALRISVEAENQPPVADAGLDQRVVIGTLVQLSGAGSYDANGDSLTYNWRFVNTPPGSQASLSIAGSPANPRFSPDLTGPYVVELTVSDGNLTSSPDLVTVTVEEQGGSSSSGGSDSSDCLSCAASPEELSQQWSLGGAAHGLGLALLPFAILAWRRREDAGR